MKVEIELQDLEALNKQNSILEEQNKELTKKLSELDEKALKEQARDLASNMFHAVMKKVFEELNFETRFNLTDIDFVRLEDYLGEKWYHSDKLVVEIGGTITTEFKQAFIKLGFKI